MLKRKINPLNRFEKFILALNYAGAFALLLAYIAPYVNPASFWPLAFFSIGYMPVLCTNAVFVVFWLVRLRRYALISAVCIFIGMPLMVRCIGFRKPGFNSVKATPAAIRVMTYNVYAFLNAEEDNRTGTNDQVLNIIQTEQPDILNLQEYFTHNADRGLTETRIKQALGTKYSWFKPLKTTPYDSTGTAIFSKYPIVGRDTIAAVNGIETEGMYIDVKKNGRIFRVYTFHLRSTKFSRQENAYLEGLSHSINPELHRPKSIIGKLKMAFQERGNQVVGLKKQLAQCPYPYIVTGDFNDTPLSFAVNYMSAGLRNAFREKGYGLGITFYGEYPGFQLDYILVSPQFNVTGYKIVHQRLSDHYPVISDLELK